MDRYELDNRDREIIAERAERYEQEEGPRVGDYVEFADGIVRRISETWAGESIQTSDEGSWHLGNHGCTFSGALYLPVPGHTLTRTDELRPGRIWIFHHDYAGAGCRVHAQIDFRVYECSLDAPEV